MSSPEKDQPIKPLSASRPNVPQHAPSSNPYDRQFSRRRAPAEKDGVLMHRHKTPSSPVAEMSRGANADRSSASPRSHSSTKTIPTRAQGSMVPADKEMTEVVLPLQKEMTKEDKVPSPKKKRDEDSEPSPKKRRLNDSRYYEALDTVLQQALEDKKEAANALVRVEDEKLLMTKEMEELKQRLASAENQKVEAETQLATKVDECKTLEDQLTTLQQRDTKREEEAKDLLLKYSSEIERVFKNA